jgi:hypothetical protein
MHVNVAKEVATLRAMSGGELRAKYAQVFGEERAGNKTWLIRRQFTLRHPTLEVGLHSWAKRD